jgi:hypothetical protein
MSARAAVIAIGIIAELADRLEAAGVTADYAPDLDTAMDHVYPLAKVFAQMEERAEQVSESARNARSSVLDAVVAAYVAAARADRPLAGFAEFDLQQWHVALVPGPAGDPASREAGVPRGTS